MEFSLPGNSRLQLIENENDFRLEFCLSKRINIMQFDWMSTFFHKFKITTSLFLAVSIQTIAQPQIQWQMCLGGSSDDRAQAIIGTTDGGFVTAGYTKSGDGDVTGFHGSNDCWITKVGSSGNLIWQKALGGSGFDIAYSIVPAGDGGFVFTGQTGSTDGDVVGNHGSNDVWVVKLNSNGEMEWKKCLGGSQNDFALSIDNTSDGGFIIAGGSSSADGDASLHRGAGDVWIVKLSSLGIIEWQKSFGGTAADAAFAIQQTSDGGFICNGYSASVNGDVSGNMGGQDYWVLKLDNTGSLQWQKSLGGSNNDRGWSVLETSDGGYIVSGNSSSSNGNVSVNNGASDFWIVKLNSSGLVEWNKSFGGSDSDACHAISQTSDGGFLLAGNCFSNNGDLSSNHGGSDILLLKINQSGIKQWQKLIGGPAGDFAYGFQITSDGGVVIAGGAGANGGDVSEHNSGEDVWLVKTSDALSSNELINSKILLLAGQNPSDDFLRLSVPEIYQGLDYQIFDGIGRIVLEGIFKNPLHEVDIRTLNAGNYLLRTKAPASAALRFTKQ